MNLNFACREKLTTEIFSLSLSLVFSLNVFLHNHYYFICVCVLYFPPQYFLYRFHETFAVLTCNSKVTVSRYLNVPVNALSLLSVAGLDM